MTPVGVAGGDVHGQRYRVGPLTIPFFPYDDGFRLIHTHVLVAERLTGDLSHDRRLILQALRQGSCYMSYDRRKSAIGFSFMTQDQSTVCATMNGSLVLGDGVLMSVTVPSEARITLKRDGVPVATVKGQTLVYEAKDPGAYRVEVYYRLLGRDRPWIFSNPIWVKPAASE